jgi:hypothetical protein
MNLRRERSVLPIFASKATMPLPISSLLRDRHLRKPNFNTDYESRRNKIINS